MDIQDEAQIITRVQAGESEPFAHLVRRYQAALFRIVGNLVGRQKAEDVVQETFLAAFRNIGTFDHRRGLFRTWLYRIARNQAFNEMKKKRHDSLLKELEPIDLRTPADQVLCKEALEHLDRALASLSFQDRAIFVLAEIEGLAYGEIARIEALRLGTVKSRLARSRAKLKTLIEPYVSHHE